MTNRVMMTPMMVKRRMFMSPHDPSPARSPQTLIVATILPIFFCCNISATNGRRRMMIDSGAGVCCFWRMIPPTGMTFFARVHISSVNMVSHDVFQLRSPRQSVLQFLWTRKRMQNRDEDPWSVLMQQLDWWWTPERTKSGALTDGKCRPSSNDV